MNIAKHKVFSELFCTNKEKIVVSSGYYYDTLKFFQQNMKSITEGIKFKFYMYEWKMQRTLPVVLILNFTEQTSYHIVYLSFKKLEVAKQNEIFYTFRIISRFTVKWFCLFVCLFV